jgi:hypothetical protein
VTAAVLDWFKSITQWFTHDILREKRREKSDLGVAMNGDAVLAKMGGGGGHEKKRECQSNSPTFNLIPSMVFWTRVRHPCN